jgi:hypothetical protein
MDGLAVTLAAELYAIGLMLGTRALFGVGRLSENNEVAGFKFAVVGVFYGVLLAFVVVSVWEDLHTTEAAVRNEAKAAVDLHRLTFALPVEGGAEIRQRLISYTDHVRKYEWPSMALGQPSDDVAKDLDQLSQTIFNVQPQGERDLALYEEALRLLTVITDNRNERLDSSDGSVPPILWFVLIIGGAMLAVLVSFSLLLGLAFDYLFSGAVHISVSPFDKALAQMPPSWPAP